MSFVGDPYPIDVFLSYSHADPKGSGEAHFLTWSRAFAEALQLEMEAQFDDSSFKLFFDGKPRATEGLDPFTSFDEQLERNAKGAALFLALVSHKYPGSDWCRREREWWRQAQEANNLAEGSRLLTAMIWGRPPKEHLDWEEAMAAMGLAKRLGTKFYAPANPLDEPHPFGWPGTEKLTRNTDFNKAMGSLVTHVYKHLHDLRAALRAPAAVPVVFDEHTKPQVYLHGRDDARKAWDDAFDALDGAGFPVVPDDGPEPVETDPQKRAKVRDKRIPIMGRSDALLLLAPEDSSIFDDELDVLSKDDRGLAIHFAETHLKQPGKKLPVAVIDPIADPERRRRREGRIRNMNLGWLSLADPGWVDSTKTWLKSALA